MRKKKLLLIHPRPKFFKEPIPFPPLWAAYLAALTPSNWEIVFIDENLEKFNFCDADLVGISTLTPTANRAYELTKVYKKDGKAVVLGGIHASMLPEEALEFCDAVVIGEAEAVWPHVIKDFENGELKKKYWGKRVSLDSLPTPRRDIFKKRYLVETLQTSRGCPMNCDFCSVTAFQGHTYRTRSLEEVLKEIKLLKGRYVFFTDDNLIGYSNESRNRTIDLFKAMVDQRVNKVWAAQVSINFAVDDEVLFYAARSGCRGVLIGFESISQNTLRKMNKSVNVKYVEHYERFIEKIHKFGISILGNIIVGNDGEKAEIFEESAKFFSSVKLDALTASLPIPYPGTRLFNRLNIEKRIIYDNFPEDWDKYFLGPNFLFRHSSLTREEIERGCDIMCKYLWSYCLSAKFYLNLFFRTKSIRIATILICVNLGFRKLFSRDQRERMVDE